ncbi:LysE family transporter [Streptomyces sp. MB09-01]|uniref:LysE family transporter n=1 Tax=Streptomyces sp. MB09-01 TaxID=3028666 RepID=UPI0029A84790|nr:LysE family transporter [Streptomyces sp. MB09-01]MDX3533668.1 LysE family transporter [Streptomyces sp. MB09-01]
MSELMTPALAGAVAGLGVAMPMGAMSVLLLQEAVRHRRTAVAAAAGIAAVDLGYAALATAVGPWAASHISPVEAWVRLASAAVLLAIAAHGLSSSTRPTDPAPPAREARGPGRSPDPSAPPALEARGPGRSPGSGGAAAGTGTRTGTRPAARAFARYVGLTALNPTTALYFAALTTAQGATLGTGPAGAAFLLGVGAASLLWQQALVVLGSLAGTRISDTARAWTFRLGYGLVAAYALKIAFPLPSLG